MYLFEDVKFFFGLTVHGTKVEEGLRQYILNTVKCCEEESKTESESYETRREKEKEGERESDRNVHALLLFCSPVKRFFVFPVVGILSVLLCTRTRKATYQLVYRGHSF